MKLKLIKNDRQTDRQLHKALERVNHLWEAENDTPERDELEVLSYVF